MKRTIIIVMIIPLSAFWNITFIPLNNTSSSVVGKITKDDVMETTNSLLRSNIRDSYDGRVIIMDSEVIARTLRITVG